jgi:hypothetical protein
MQRFHQRTHFSDRRALEVGWNDVNVSPNIPKYRMLDTGGAGRPKNCNMEKHGNCRSIPEQAMSNGCFLFLRCLLPTTENNGEAQKGCLCSQYTRLFVLSVWVWFKMISHKKMEINHDSPYMRWSRNGIWFTRFRTIVVANLPRRLHGRSVSLYIFTEWVHLCLRRTLL